MCTEKENRFRKEEKGEGSSMGVVCTIIAISN